MMKPDKQQHEQQPPVLSLHDSLALGEVELGLTTEDQTSNSEKQLEEIHRLPVLLRLLSAARPLSSVPSFWDAPNENGDNNDDDDPTTTTAVPIDELANQVVARLEDVAATYSVAEGVDVVACHLAPSICRNLSKVAPLKRQRRESLAAAVGSNGNSTDGAGGWETQELMVVGANPRSSFKRPRLSPTTTTATTNLPSGEGKAAESADELNLEEECGAAGSVGMLSEGGLSSDEEGRASADRRLSRRGSEPSEAAGAEDSQEELVSKTLSDLAVLVASSLEPIKLDHQDVDADSSSRQGRFLLAVVDSALSEPFRTPSAADSVRGVMTGSDLGSTVAALMHHAPVLRHQHVANALCRAALPQTADLVKRMGANCPSACPSLLRGCIDAYKKAVAVIGSRHSGISNAAKAAIHALADLSEREKSRVRTVLQQDGILVDLQLKLAISQDRLSALCLLLQHLSIHSNESPVQDNVRSDLSLKALLQTTPDLLITTLEFLKDETLSIVEAEGLDQNFGRSCLLIRCWTWLVAQCDVMSTLQSPGHDGVKTFSLLLSALQALGDRIQGTSKGSSMSTLRSLTLLFCASILTQARLTSFDTTDQAVVEQCKAWVKNCFEYHSNHAGYGTMVARIACSLKINDIKAFSRLLQNILNNDVSSGSFSLVLTPELEQGVLKSWESMTDFTNFEALLKNKLAQSSPLDASALIDFFNFAEFNPGDMTEELKAHLTNQLCGADNYSGQSHQKMPELIVKATAYFAKHTTINIPIISPLQLESSAAKLDLSRLKRQLSTEDMDFKFFYQVLYWFAYMDAGANSLFEFDARVLPLKEVLSCSRRMSRSSPGYQSSLALYLEYFVDKHCPEVIVNLERWELVKDSRVNLTNAQKHLDRKAVKRQLSKALKAAVSHEATDQSASMAESTFILARGLLGDADLCTQVVSALLAAPNSPPPFCTYSMLCRDPLVLLKAPMQAWRYSGLRRIVLTLTASLLEANDAVSPSDSSADELIAARNLLLVRGLLVAVSGSDEGSPDNTPHMCSMTTNFLRKMIAKNRGLMGLLVKQSPALPDCAQDWLVEFVPETMDDASSLISVFTERGSVTARLTAAAAIVRIAIAHGHRNEATAERLVYAALAQLVSSFFLVVGPVGVPVNVLIGDGSLDVTQTSRRATFRIFRSLVNVRGRQRSRLRNECGMALHKICGLCKDQNSLSGVAASRRKALLREMFEEISKAASAMGSGIDL